MPNNLLIVGAGEYSVVAYEIAKSMGCFDEIGFVDDYATQTSLNIPVLGTVDSIENLSEIYGKIILAIGNPMVKSALWNKIKNIKNIEIATLISPNAFVSPSATVGAGTIVEPFGLVGALCKIGKGCIISSGGVVNHHAECGDFVHIDCNATVESSAKVPSETKLCSGEVFSKNEPAFSLSKKL